MIFPLRVVDLLYQNFKMNLNYIIMKKLLVGLALVSFVLVTTVGVSAHTTLPQEKAKKEVKKEKKATKDKKACCSDKTAKKSCDDKKKTDKKKKK